MGRELAIVMPKQMLDMQVMAAGEGFASLSDKWAAEERIREACDAIARETAYSVAPALRRRMWRVCVNG